MDSFLFDLKWSASPRVWQEIGPTSCDRAACLFRRPGFAKAKALGFGPVESQFKLFCQNVAIEPPEVLDVPFLGLELRWVLLTCCCSI